MSRITLLVSLFISLFILGCSSTKNLSKQTENASQAYVAGDYETAFNLYNAFINEQQSKKKEVTGEVFGAASKAALQNKKYMEAVAFFKEATYKGYGDADLYANMQSIYRKIDNLSKEIGVLEYFVKNYTTDARFLDLHRRLFETYIESENWEKAVELWKSFDAVSQNDIKMMELDMIALEKLGKDSDASSMAAAILKKSVTNRTALEWLANSFFWKAEKRYQNELEAYEKNKTNKQYNIMLKALDVVTADFKKSLKYYEMLYKLYPTKEYAKYMSNIYTRFQDKNKSDFYLNLSK